MFGILRLLLFNPTINTIRAVIRVTLPFREVYFDCCGLIVVYVNCRSVAVLLFLFYFYSSNGSIHHFNLDFPSSSYVCKTSSLKLYADLVGIGDVCVCSV